jgi:hypothetical protein
MITSSISLGIFDSLSPNSYQLFDAVENTDFANRAKYRLLQKIQDQTTVMTVGNSNTPQVKTNSTDNKTPQTPKKVETPDINNVNFRIRLKNESKKNVDFSNYSNLITRKYKDNSTPVKSESNDKELKVAEANNAESPKVSLPDNGRVKENKNLEEKKTESSKYTFKVKGYKDIVTPKSNNKENIPDNVSPSIPTVPTPVKLEDNNKEKIDSSKLDSRKFEQPKLEVPKTESRKTEKSRLSAYENQIVASFQRKAAKIDSLE